jgi:bacillolysin
VNGSSLRRLGVWSLFAISVVSAPALAAGPDFIESLTEPGEGLSVKSVSKQTGRVTFAGSNRRGILLTVPASATAEERAANFVQKYGRAFGIENASEVRPMRAAERDSLGFEHVRLQQVHEGIPIRGAELVIHLKGPRVMAANGHAIRDLPANVTPRISAAEARSAVRRAFSKYGMEQADIASYGDARLEILNRTLLSAPGYDSSHLAWFVEVTGPALRRFVWVDAQTGAILLQFSQLKEAKKRTVYNANHVPGVLPGTLVRIEGGDPTGDADQDLAYDYAGAMYDYYLTNHNRDSYDGLGGELRSSVHYCENPNCPTFGNAFWNGSQVVYGDGFTSADDVVAHELTHAVTDRTAGFLYYNQSGALDESFADIFGETIDLTDGLGNDASNVRWLIGEDLPGDPLRSMSEKLPGFPAKLSDPEFKCSTAAWTDPLQDSGGVHYNSAVPNHAYALMVDGGTYNGRTITGIGLTKAAAIEYRALTVYLTSGSGFIDDYDALNQSCSDLAGASAITPGDCTQMLNALDAVEMGNPWPCPGRVEPPPTCPSGTAFLTTIEGFENGMGNWTPENSLGTWEHLNDFARTGKWSVYGTDPNGPSDHSVVMTSTVTVPAGGRLYFDHAFEFESTPSFRFDGGVVEYSTDNGTTWIDAGSLVDAGAGYNGTLYNGNTLGMRPAFTSTSWGFTGTRLDLSSLAGHGVQFRFRIGSDANVAGLGWIVDNIAIYRCSAAIPFTDDPIVAGSTIVKAVHINELRERINANRTARGLGLVVWNETLSPGTTLIKAAHIEQLRAALADSYAAAGVPLPTYTDPSISSGTASKAAHINELRSALVVVESPP